MYLTIYHEPNTFQLQMVAENNTNRISDMWTLIKSKPTRLCFFFQLKPVLSTVSKLINPYLSNCVSIPCTLMFNGVTQLYSI